MNQTTKETLTMLEKHPLTIALKAEEAAAILKQREEAASTIKELVALESETLPPLLAELEKTKDALTLHDTKRQGLQSKVQAAASALASQKHQISFKREQAETALFTTADPQIDEAIQYFRDMHATLLKKTINSDKHVGERNLITERQKIVVYSNQPSIVAGLAYCLEMTKVLEKMKLDAALDIEQIGALKAGIPDADAMVEFTGDKPLPGTKTPRLRDTLMSDDQSDWMVGKLLEKANKLLHPKKR